MSKELKYYDEDGNERSLYWMVRNLPGWAQSRLAFYAKNQRPKDWDKWITPEKYKELTGEEWIGPVWVRIEIGFYDTEYDWGLTNALNARDDPCVVIANNHGIPDPYFIPEEQTDD